MKNLIFSLALLGLFFTSCDKSDSRNSGLNGDWELVAFEEATGSTETPLILGIALPSTCEIELNNPNYLMSITDENIRTEGTYDLTLKTTVGEDIVKVEEAYDYSTATEYSATADSILSDKSIIEVRLTSAVEPYAVETNNLAIETLNENELVLSHSTVEYKNYSEMPSIETVIYRLDFRSVWRRAE